MYTFKPSQKHAKAYGANLGISTKGSEIICRVIRGKKLNVVERLINDIITKKRSLNGKYYTKTAKAVKDLIEGCKKNAEYIGLDNKRLFVHASAHKGVSIRRRRRKAGFGSKIKSTNIELILIEK